MRFNRHDDVQQTTCSRSSRVMDQRNASENCPPIGARGAKTVNVQGQAVIVTYAGRVWDGPPFLRLSAGQNRRASTWRSAKLTPPGSLG